MPRSRRLDLGPLLELGAGTTGRDERVVGRGTVRIDVREAARDDAAAARFLHGCVDGLGDRVVERGEAVPGARRFERVADDAHADERALQIGRIEEGLLPARCVVGVVIDRRRTVRATAAARGCDEARGATEFTTSVVYFGSSPSPPRSVAMESARSIHGSTG